MKKYIILLIILSLLCLARDAASEPPRFYGSANNTRKGYRCFNATGIYKDGVYTELEHRHNNFNHLGINGDDDTAGELAEELFSWI